jgi:hypothetical protein
MWPTVTGNLEYQSDLATDWRTSSLCSGEILMVNTLCAKRSNFTDTDETSRLHDQRCDQSVHCTGSLISAVHW